MSNGVNCYLFEPHSGLENIIFPMINSTAKWLTYKFLHDLFGLKFVLIDSLHNLHLQCTLWNNWWMMFFTCKNILLKWVTCEYWDSSSWESATMKQLLFDCDNDSIEKSMTSTFTYHITWSYTYFVSMFCKDLYAQLNLK